MAPPASGAQRPGKVSRIGWLRLNKELSPRHEAFLEGLRELGWVEGKNISIVQRSAEWKNERLPGLAGELVRLKVDIIVALEPPAARAAKEATQTISIVMRSTSHPVAEGFVASLARPGGNVTGVYSFSEDLKGKRLELLKETVPGIRRVAVLWSSAGGAADRMDVPRFRAMETAARALGLELQSLPVQSPEDFEGVFRAAARGRAGALTTIRNPLIVKSRKRIAQFAAERRLPAIYDDREFVEAGGLMSYGVNLTESYRRAAYYVDRILKGAKPADLPVEQPTRFELVINLKTAKALGLTIPPEILLQADRVIK